MKRWVMAAGALFILSDQALAKPVVADLAIRSIHIDARFTGLDILLFGARDEHGDIVIVVRGPEKRYIVRKKERIAGIWANRDMMVFDKVNDFYAVASSRPLDRIKNMPLQQTLGIGLDTLKFDYTEAPYAEEFRTALIDGKERQRVYSKDVRPVSFWGETLFRTMLHFPANISNGIYTVEVYLISDGALTAMQVVPLAVGKTGIEADIYQLAHQRPGLYGVLAVAIALIAGWLANILFRRVARD